MTARSGPTRGRGGPSHVRARAPRVPPGKTPRSGKGPELRGQSLGPSGGRRRLDSIQTGKPLYVELTASRVPALEQGLGREQCTADGRTRTRLTHNRCHAERTFHGIRMRCSGWATEPLRSPADSAVARWVAPKPVLLVAPAAQPCTRTGMNRGSAGTRAARRPANYDALTGQLKRSVTAGKGIGGGPGSRGVADRAAGRELTASLIGRVAARYGLPAADLLRQWTCRSSPARLAGGGVQTDGEIVLNEARRDVLAGLCGVEPTVLARTLHKGRPGSPAPGHGRTTAAGPIRPCPDTTATVTATADSRAAASRPPGQRPPHATV